MKKIISIVMVCAMLLSVIVLPSYASDELVSPNRVPGLPDPRGAYLKFSDLDESGNTISGSGSKGYSCNTQDYTKEIDGVTVLFDVMFTHSKFGGNGEMAQIPMIVDGNHTWTYSFAKKHKGFEIAYAGWPTYAPAALGESYAVYQNYPIDLEKGTNKWYRVAYKVEDLTFSIWLNGEKIAEHEFEDMGPGQQELQHSYLIFYPTYVTAYFDNWVTAAGDFDVATETGTVYDVHTFETGKRNSAHWEFSSNFSVVGEDLKPYVKPKTNSSVTAGSVSATAGTKTVTVPLTVKNGEGQEKLNSFAFYVDYDPALKLVGLNGVELEDGIVEGSQSFDTKPYFVGYINKGAITKDLHFADLVFEVPSGEGEYDVRLVTGKNAQPEDCYGFNLQPVPTDLIAGKITLSKQVNEWTTALTMKGWTEGQTAQKPNALAKFGTVKFVYTDASGKTLASAPTAAGTYSVKAVVDATDTYTGLESSAVSFTIIGKNEWTTALTMKGWTEGQTVQKPNAAAKYGTVKYVYMDESGKALTAAPTKAGKYSVKAVVDATDTYTGLESSAVSFEILKAYILGDANSDGKVNNVDVITILRKLANWDLKVFDKDAADVNKDGKINNTDVILILRYLANWKLEYNIGK